MSNQRLGRYDQIDEAQVQDQARLIGALDAQNRYPSNIRIKDEMRHLLDVQPGDRVLDVGSGTRDDTRRLAGLAGQSGQAYGIDSSSVMVEEAARRSHAAGDNVVFRVGDALELEFEDAMFDRVWSERLFIWLEHPHRAFEEILRVTKPGGRISLSTYDTASGIRGGFEPELNELLLSQVPRQMPSPAVGRLLPAWCYEAGLADIVVRPQIVEHPIMDTSSPIYLITKTQIDSAVRSGTFTPEQATTYWEAMDGAIQARSFYTVLFAFIVAATKPVD